MIDATIIREPSSNTVVDKPNNFSVGVALLPRLLHPSLPTWIVTSLSSPSCKRDQRFGFTLHVNKYLGYDYCTYLCVQECDFISGPREFRTVVPVSAPFVAFQKFHQFARCRFRFFRHIIVRLGITFGVLRPFARRTLDVEQPSLVVDFVFPLVIRTEKSRKNAHHITP